MLSRRRFLAGSLVAPALLSGRATLTAKERVDRALKGQEPDRTPFTFWRHFHDESKSPEKHAEATLNFHRRYRTDLVKVMSDYHYPRPKGSWRNARVEENPFPQQIRALELIRDGLGGEAYFVETIFNPWYVAEKLSSREQVLTLMRTKPQALMNALETIAKSEANHARRALAAGASGIFLAIQNAQTGVLSEAAYAKFSEPFDKMVLAAAASAPLNILHLHSDAALGDHLYAERFYQGWPVAAINYSSVGTRVGVAELRRKFSGVIMAGLDERRFGELSKLELVDQWTEARKAAGAKFILAPGCSTSDHLNDEELGRLPTMLGA
jgi:uroporphyrinogen decarboxylase